MVRAKSDKVREFEKLLENYNKSQGKQFPEGDGPCVLELRYDIERDVEISTKIKDIETKVYISHLDIRKVVMIYEGEETVLHCVARGFDLQPKDHEREDLTEELIDSYTQKLFEVNTENRYTWTAKSKSGINLKSAPSYGDAVTETLKSSKVYNEAMEDIVKDRVDIASKCTEEFIEELSPPGLKMTKGPSDEELSRMETELSTAGDEESYLAAAKKWEEKYKAAISGFQSTEEKPSPSIKQRVSAARDFSYDVNKAFVNRIIAYGDKRNSSVLLVSRTTLEALEEDVKQLFLKQINNL